MNNQHFFIFAIVTTAALSISSAGFADPPAHAKNSKAKVGQQMTRHSNNSASVAVGTHCPPGLAKKSPACVPPGQAKKRYQVGDIVDWDIIHLVTQPGRYGLSTPPEGARYAVVDGQLVRVDSRTGQILSILRIVDAILD